MAPSETVEVRRPRRVNPEMTASEWAATRASAERAGVPVYEWIAGLIRRELEITSDGKA